MRVLGVDLGKVRIGVAVGVAESRVATARQPLKAFGALAKDADQIADLAKTEAVDAIVVGVPYNREDDRMANVCERFAQILRELGWNVETVDEAGTSAESDAAMRDAGVKASLRSKRVDSESAVQILERYFIEKGS